MSNLKTFSRKSYKRIESLGIKDVSALRLILEDLYWNKGLTLQQVGKQLGFSKGTIKTWMNKLGIPKRDCRFKKGSIPWIKGKTHSKEVREKLSKLNSKKRPPKKELEVKYKIEKLSLSEIANIYGVSDTTVLNWLVHYDIPRRPISEALSIKLKKFNWLRGRKSPNNRRVTVVCIQCGKKFEVSPSALKTKRFCSKNCKYAFWRGKKQPEELRKKRGERIREYLRRHPEEKSKRTRQLLEAGRRFFENPANRERIRAHALRVLEKINNSPEVRAKVLRKLRKRPTSLELKVMRVLDRYFDGWRYTGDGKVVIGGKVPDLNGKKIIEVWGRYWHRNDDPRERIEFFRKHGYDCLVIWEDELKFEDNLVKRISAFMRADFKDVKEPPICAIGATG